MNNKVALRAFAAFALGLGAVALPILAEDTKPTTEPPPKAPNWSGYVSVADVVGEVVKADDKSVTVRITWFEPQMKNGNKGKTGNNGNRNNRPRLGQNNRNFRNPFASNMNRPNQPQVQWKEQHHDYDLEYVADSLVRTRSLPPKYDDKGEKAPHTQKEIDELRTPPGVPGYAASRFDLTPGTVVDLHLMRKSSSAAKATEDDLRIKYVVILGRNTNAPKDGAGNKGANKDKKNGKKKN